MSDIDNVYNDIVMEHSMNSPNKHELENCSFSVMGTNPNCGDEIKLQVLFDGGKIKDIAFTGHGCAISQSSTSIMIDTLRGKTTDEANKIIDIFIKMIKREKISNDEKMLLKDSVAFENISNMPARVKCALLSWHTLQDSLKTKK